MSNIEDVHVDEIPTIQITDRIISEKILHELLKEEFAMSLTMALFKVELVELTDKSRYKCVILFGTDIQTDIRRMAILVNANNMNSEIQRVVDRVHMYLLDK